MFPNIRAEMARFGKTQKDISKILGISVCATTLKLKGKSPFTLTEITKLADAFNCTIDYLVGYQVKGDDNNGCGG